MSRAHMPGPTFRSEPVMNHVRMRQRQEKLSMRAVADAAGISISTLTRLAAGHNLDAVSLGRILVWLGQPPYWMTLDE